MVGRPPTGFIAPGTEENPSDEYVMPPVEEIVRKLRVAYNGNLVAFLRGICRGPKNRYILMSAIRKELTKPENKEHLYEWEGCILDYQMNNLQGLEGVFWENVADVVNKYNLTKDNRTEETRTEFLKETKRIATALSSAKFDIGKRLEALLLLSEPEEEKPDKPQVDPEVAAAKQRLDEMVKSLGYTPDAEKGSNQEE